MRRIAWALAFGVVAAAAAGWLLRSTPPLSPPVRSDSPGIESTPSGRVSDDAFADAVRLLTDPTADIKVRRKMAVLLGTRHGDRGKKAVLQALRSGALAGLERAAILALGIRGEFTSEGMPFAVEAAEGLFVCVRDPILDADMRTELVRRLAESPEPDARRAAALVLRDSVGFPEVREALLGRVGVERDSETAAESAAAVATWARRVPPEEGDRPRIIARVTDALPQGDELFRFRLLSPMGEVAMKPAESARVRTLLDAPDPDLRAFAADVLGRRLEAHPGRDLEAVPALIRALGDSSDAVRESVALALGRALGDERARESLLRSLRGDPDWEVRAASARALGSHPAPASVQALEEAAASDSRLEVRQAATRSLAVARSN